METDKAQAGTVGQPGAVTAAKYSSVRLTENEVAGAVAVNDQAGRPEMLFVTTKRADLFPVGRKIRFRNKCSECGWTVTRAEPVFLGRAEIVLKFPQRIYGKRRKKEIQ